MTKPLVMTSLLLGITIAIGSCLLTVLDQLASDFNLSDVTRDERLGGRSYDRISNTRGCVSISDFETIVYSPAYKNITGRYKPYVIDYLVCG